VATITLKGGDKIAAALRKIANNLEKGKQLKVGFLANATYPATVHRPKQGGLPVAQVAFWDEFGTKFSPPRPFFRQMIEKNEPTWAPMLVAALKQHEYDADAALKILGIEMTAELQESIQHGDFAAPSEITLMLRKMADEDPSLVITRRTVGIAAAKVEAGETGATGDRARALLDTKVMLQAVDYEVSK